MIKSVISTRTSFAEYAVLIDALWPENRFLGPLLCYAFLPSALIAILFPNAAFYHPLSFYAIHLFVMHAGIAAYIVARYAAGEIRLTYQGVWVTFFAIAVLVAPIYLIDLAFDENYVFLIDHGGNPALKFIWDLSGGTGGIPYILCLGALVLIVFHVAYGIFAAAERVNRVPRREARQSE